MATVSVLVVGAGPTGLLAAAELLRRGVDCLLIDAHEQAMGWDRATVVHPRSLEIFEQLRIVEPFLAAGVRQHKVHIRSAGASLGEIDLSLCGSRYSFNMGISEEVTERILADHLLSMGGRIVRATRLVGLEEGDNGVLATLEHEGIKSEVLAQWVIGCDGHNSTVRTIAGIVEEGHDIPDPWAVFDASVHGWTESFEANYAYLDDIPVVLTSLPGGRWRVYLRPASGESDLANDALSTLRRYLPEARFEEVANPTRFQCHTKVAQRYRSGRMLLAGDAAHTCSPAQGHGMNSGLQDAFNLAWKLALVCQGHCSDRLLDSYQAERRPVAEMITESGDATDSGQMIRGPARRHQRDTAIRAAFSDPQSRHHEAVAEAELDIDYADSPIVMGDRSGPILPGQRLPDGIGILLAEGGTGRLYQLADRAGHTALVLGSRVTANAELAEVRRRVEAASDGAIIEAIISIAARPDAPSADVSLDQVAADRFGPDGVTLLVVRPDGHVGLCVVRDHAAALAAYAGLLRSGGI